MKKKKRGKLTSIAVYCPFDSDEDHLDCSMISEDNHIHKKNEKGNCNPIGDVLDSSFITLLEFSVKTVH